MWIIFLIKQAADFFTHKIKGALFWGKSNIDFAQTAEGADRGQLQTIYFSLSSMCAVESH